MSRREFDTGAVRDDDTNKVDFVETISWTAFNRYADYMTSKKNRYGDGNFKKGIPIEAYEQSLMRHIDKYFRNKYEGGTDEPDEDHLSAAVFNIFGIIHEEERKPVNQCGSCDSQYINSSGSCWEHRQCGEKKKS